MIGVISVSCFFAKSVLFKDVLSKGPADQAKEIERLSDLVGLPTLTSKEKLDVSGEVFRDFRKQGEALYAKEPDLDIEDINQKAEEYAKKLTDAAVVVYEMDRIADVLSARAQEGITLLSLFPDVGGVVSGDPTAGAEKSYKFANQMKNIANQGQAMRERQKGLSR